MTVPLLDLGSSRRAGEFAEPVDDRISADRRHRAVDPEAGPCARRRLRRHVRHLEHEVGDVQLAARRRFDVRLPDRDGRGAAGDPRAADRHRGSAAVRRPAGWSTPLADDVDGKAVVRNRRTAARQVSNRRVDADVDAAGACRARPARSTHSRTSGTIRTGQMRFSADADIGVRRRTQRQPRLAGIIDRCRSRDADLAIADVRPASASTRWLSVSNRRPMAMRLKISGGSSSAPGEHDRAAAKPSCQSAMLSLGGSTCASSVTRLAPETILNGATSTRRAGIPLDVDFGADRSPSDSPACRGRRCARRPR